MDTVTTIIIVLLVVALLYAIKSELNCDSQKVQSRRNEKELARNRIAALQEKRELENDLKQNDSE